MPIDLTKPVPLYLQIAEDISAKVAAGDLRIGDQLGSQQELSLQYHVSLITVKKALAHLAHQGWIYSRMGKGAFVAQQSPAPPQVAHRSIGVVLENLKSPFFSLIVQAVEEAAYQQGYNVLLSNSSGRTDKEEQQIQHLRKIGASGLIIASLRHVYHATPVIRTLHRDRFPFVMVSYMDDPRIPHVGTNHEEGGHLATQHLIKLGYERIGYLNAERGNLVGELRKRGYACALREAGREVEKRFQFRLRVHGIRNYFRAGEEAGRRFCQIRGRRPDALFVFNDPAALGFQKAVMERGLRVPDDVALVGFDNIEQDEYAAVPLTSVHQPVDRIGGAAVEFLVRTLCGRKPAVRSVFPPSLVVRESCGAHAHRRAGSPRVLLQSTP